MEEISEKIIAFLPQNTIEPEALQQIRNTASLSFLFKHVAVMPDCHFGKGATVGTVLATSGAIVPAAVGVDIGCGMIAVKTTLKKDDILGKLEAIKIGIERRIPMSAGRFNTKITESAQKRIDDLITFPGIKTAQDISGNWKLQLGTLGGGNHFIEICLDENDDVWVTLHSGSRGVGNKIGNKYIEIAKKICEKYKIQLPDPDLSYLVEETPEFYAYITDLRWAQHFALLNREEMLDRVMMEISTAIFDDYTRGKELESERINCHHNFTQIEHHFHADVWVTRKGAIDASEGKLALIPGSMGTRSYIVKGLGNPLSFHSAPHGAGRKMSRQKAKKTFSHEDLQKSMAGIVFRDSDVLIDEIPGAYKDIDEVMENARELVSIEHILHQLLNVKGD